MVWLMCFRYDITKTVNCLLQSTKVCEMLRVEEMKLWLQEEKIRHERSSMIKKLASLIAGKFVSQITTYNKGEYPHLLP